MNYDVIIIGAGPGGYVAALQAAKLGMKVAVVENRESGGTCLNRGCIPTKTMLHASHLYHQMCHSTEMGVAAGSVQVDMDAIYARKNQISQKLSSGIDSMFKSAKVDKLTGTGMVMDSHTVQVSGPEGTELHTADNILVATGSVPARPPIPGLDLPGIMTSDELLDGAAKQISQAIANRLTPRQLLLAMRPHPTFEEALGEALEDLAAKLEK